MARTGMNWLTLVTLSAVMILVTGCREQKEPASATDSETPSAGKKTPKSSRQKAKKDGKTPTSNVETQAAEVAAGSSQESSDRTTSPSTTTPAGITAATIEPSGRSLNVLGPASVRGVAFTAPTGPSTAETISKRTDNLKSEIGRLAESSATNEDLDMLTGAVSNVTFEYERYTPLNDTQNNLLMEQAETVREALTSATQVSAGERGALLKEAGVRLDRLNEEMKKALGK